MAPSPDLFVVCKNCQAEVSPYITECPYCGHRLRKRAPKLDKGGTPKPPRKPRADRVPRLGKLRRNEIPGIRHDRRPYVALALFAVPAFLAPLVTTLLAAFGAFGVFELAIVAGLDGDPWRLLTTTLSYGDTGYEIVALAVIFTFGWLLERRHGWWAPLGVYLAGSIVGGLAALAVDSTAFVVGGLSGAFALLGAWVVRDALAVRAGEETDTDWLLVAAAALVLAAVPAIYHDGGADPIAGLAGALLGLLLGVPLARLRER